MLLLKGKYTVRWNNVQISVSKLIATLHIKAFINPQKLLFCTYKLMIFVLSLCIVEN